MSEKIYSQVNRSDCYSTIHKVQVTELAGGNAATITLPNDVSDDFCYNIIGANGSIGNSNVVVTYNSTTKVVTFTNGSAAGPTGPSGASGTPATAAYSGTFIVMCVK